MKPAVSSNKEAIMAALLVGGFALWWYFRPFPWLGAIMAVLSGAFTYFTLTTKRMERFRRVIFIGLSAVVLVSLTVIISNTGVGGFMNWVNVHKPAYYLPGQYIGTQSFPCALQVPQVMLGRAAFLPGFGLWEVTFPSSLTIFLIVMIPFIATLVVFGRGFCGWLCPVGGITEAFVTGNKERWKLNFLKTETVTPGGRRYGGLKEWVRDTKYGILAAIILLSVFLIFPLVCVFCPVFWLTAMPVFWTAVGLIVVFGVVLPFMTKGRWWCQICPVGAIFSLVNKISFFRVRIDKKKCIRCFDCVQECRMYALTPDAVEKSGHPNENCIRCGRCIEICSEGAADMYWMGTQNKVRSAFISLVIVAILAWYAWFVLLLADRLIGLLR